jgi:hypothetical protein
MKNIIIAIFATVILFASCKITTHIHFNKDNSGKVKIEMDMTEIMAGMDDSAARDFSDSIKESFEKSGALPGAKNYKISFEEKVMTMSYDFDNVKDLNLSLQELNKEETNNKQHDFFSASKKSMTYTTAKKEKTEGEEELDGMADMFQMSFKVSFAKKIVKCDNESYTINKEDNSVTMQGTATDFIMNEKMSFSVKLK